MITLDPFTAWEAVRHGFFTREHGVSQGIYASLNCGYGSGDDPAKVRRNRAAAMARLDLSADDLVTCHQTHSADAITVTAPWAHADAPVGDAMATDRAGIALGILTADCAPVLFADPEAGVIGACHAGWRGALDGVLEATLGAMAAIGARRERVAAAIGPCIGAASYEVGPEFPDPFLALDPGNRAFFRAAPRAGHWLFDLPGYVAGRLAGAGVTQVARAGHDTAAEPGRFFSYRRACQRGEPDYGRCLSAIALADRRA